MSNKTFFLKSEGDNWFLRNINKFEQTAKMESSELLYSWLEPFSDSINAICEIGCGNRHNLSYLSEMLGASGYGIDPSKKAYEYISKKFPKIKTMIGTGDDIQFENDQFDHLHLGFFYI